MQATPIRGPTAFAPTLCFAQVSHDRWSKHVRSDYECRRSKRAWSNCILCIPFILSGSSNECWLHTCNACVITTWRLGLRAPLVARKNYAGSGLGPEGGVIAVVDLGEGPGGARPPPLIFRPNWGPKGGKNFMETGPPPYLRIWITGPPLFWRSGSATGSIPYMLVFFKMIIIKKHTRCL